jgi:hypothetical protein
VDTWARATGAAEENSGKDMALVMGNVKRINAAFPEMTTAFVHHLNAGGTKLRGHTSIPAASDQVLLVVRDEANPRMRTVTVAKQKDEEDGAAIQFMLDVVGVGYREDGQEITSCVPVPYRDKPGTFSDSGRPKGPKLPDSVEVIFSCLKDALAEEGIPTPASLGLPRDVNRVVDWKKWRDRYRQQTDDLTDNALSQAMKRAGDKLLTKRLIGRRNPWVWLTYRGGFTAPHDVAASPEFPDRFHDDEK